MEIPFGECHCGCHGRAPIATRNWFTKGIIKGQPHKFIQGHNRPNMKSDRYKVEDRGYETPCWIWQLFIHGNGYGQVRINGRETSAHVAAWEAVNGPVPEGHEIHHKCRVKPCVNPDHLQCVTPEEHRLLHVAERNCCSFGHEWTEANTYVTKAGARYCRACKARRQREFGREKYWRQKGLPPPVKG